MAEANTDMQHLETILRELKKAVVVCDSSARILLYNTAAGTLFHDYETMGLGQSLYRVCAHAPVEHALKTLKGRTADSDFSGKGEVATRFVCADAEGRILLNCHVSMLSFGPENDLLFVCTFEDITSEIGETGRQGYLLEKMIQDLRAPITNLNVAAGNLQEYPEMAPEIRGELEEVIIRESAELTRRFEDFAAEAARTVKRQWPLFDVYSADLIGCVARRFKDKDGVKVTMTGVPLWLHADSYLLMLLLDRLVRLVRDSRRVAELDIEVLLGDRRVYIDIVWQGEPIPQQVIDTILTETLPETGAAMTVGDVLARHDSEIWSQLHRRQDYALLRVPVPDSPKQWELPSEPFPARQEFYDFSLAETSGAPGEMAAQPLSSLPYVVFDIETTGLRPAEGDEILSIAAVRIVNGRILSGERFERFIRPQRTIQERSVPFLEITDEMLQGEPPVEAVLPQFRSFVSNAVLVGHNPTLDVQFFRLQEESTGVAFDSPVLDTLLMTLIADKGRTNYTLEDISRWLDIDIMGSRTIMDECFVTAQIFLRLLDLLAEKGIGTLGELSDACRKVAEEKRRQAG